MLNPSTPSVAIIIPNWNGLDELGACLDSLKNQTYKISIIVVDNGSVDKSTAFIRANYSDIIVLEEPTNLGFAGGVNVGIKYAMSEGYTFIGLFNNDAVADRNWVKELVKCFSEQEDIGIATSLLLHSDGKTIDSTGEFYSKWGLSFPRERNKGVRDASESGFVFGATGGATLYKASIFEDIGVFDEDFFAYYEDADISFRAQLAGYKIVYTSKAIAYHKQGVTSNKIPGFAVYQTFKNLPLLFLKNVPKGLLLPIGGRFYLAYLLMFVNTFKHGTGWSATKGVFKSLQLTPKALYRRRGIQKNKRVSTDYIKSILWNDLPPDQTGIRKFRKLFTGK